MRIGIEASLLLAKHLTGIEYSLTELVRHLTTVDSHNEYLLYFNFSRAEYAARFEERVRPLLSERVRAHICRVPAALVWKARNHLHWPIDSSLGRCGAVYYHAMDLRPQWFGARVLAIHDLMPFTHRSHFEEAHADHFIREVPRMARKADALIAVSQHTKDMIVEHIGVSADKIFVARHGVDPQFRRLPDADVEAFRIRSGLRRPYLLFVGTAEPRKNLLRLADAFARLRSQGHEDLQLVVAGKAAWGSAALRQQIDALGLAQHVKLLGYVPAAELPLLYNGADVFSLPSIAEGYGMPLLEAMACGVPVVASNLTALPEVYGDAAIGVDPLDPEALADAIGQVRSDSQLRSGLVTRGLRRAASFTWESSARQTVAVFERFAK